MLHTMSIWAFAANEWRTNGRICGTYIRPAVISAMPSDRRISIGTVTDGVCGRVEHVGSLEVNNTQCPTSAWCQLSGNPTSCTNDGQAYESLYERAFPNVAENLNKTPLVFESTGEPAYLSVPIGVSGGLKYSRAAAKGCHS